jgi:hypothetical protein
VYFTCVSNIGAIVEQSPTWLDWKVLFLNKKTNNNLYHFIIQKRGSISKVQRLDQEMTALTSVWAIIFAYRLINFTTKFGFDNNTRLMLQIMEWNSEVPPCNLSSASTTHFESISKITCVIRCCSMYTIAWSSARDSPSTIE